jgi:hypothetical protein
MKTPRRRRRSKPAEIDWVLVVEWLNMYLGAVAV